MAKIVSKAQIGVTAHFSIDEEECRALDAMVGYGYDAFITTFKKNMGESYMRGHEDGLKRFFESVRGIVGPAIARVDDARSALDGHKEITFKGCTEQNSAHMKELCRLKTFVAQNFPATGEGDPVSAAIKLLEQLRGEAEARK